MNRSILWNGFEIRKGTIKTEVGDVPYLIYSPAMSREIINIAIHGENSSKDDWLCFNSKPQYGNLLKESIRNNSIFIALDLYGHGEWAPSDRNFNSRSMTEKDEKEFYSKSIQGISSAIKKILKSESIDDNPISVTSISKGSGVALNLDLDRKVDKQILISPFPYTSKSNDSDILILRGSKDNLVDSESFSKFTKSLDCSSIEYFDSNHELPTSWINRAKSYIYQSQV